MPGSQHALRSATSRCRRPTHSSTHLFQSEQSWAGANEKRRERVSSGSAHLNDAGPIKLTRVRRTHRTTPIHPTPATSPIRTTRLWTPPPSIAPLSPRIRCGHRTSHIPLHTPPLTPSHHPSSSLAPLTTAHTRRGPWQAPHTRCDSRAFRGRRPAAAAAERRGRRRTGVPQSCAP